MTYEDVTDIDSVGLITARQGILVKPYPGAAAETGVGVTINQGGAVFAGIVTASAGVDATDGDKNVKIGTNAGNSFTVGSAVENTLIGYDAGTAITTADSNTIIGSQAGDSITTGSNNTAVGLSLIHI